MVDVISVWVTVHPGTVYKASTHIRSSDVVDGDIAEWVAHDMPPREIFGNKSGVYVKSEIRVLGGCIHVWMDSVGRDLNSMI